MGAPWRQRRAGEPLRRALYLLPALLLALAVPISPAPTPSPTTPSPTTPFPTTAPANSSTNSTTTPPPGTPTTPAFTASPTGSAYICYMGYFGPSCLYGDPLWYSGCIDANDTIVHASIPMSAPQTPQACAKKCAELNFEAALPETTICKCSNVSDLSTNSFSDYTCDTPCPDDPSQSCGGTGAYAAYDTGFVVQDVRLSVESMAPFAPTVVNVLFKSKYKQFYSMFASLTTSTTAQVDYVNTDQYSITLFSSVENVTIDIYNPIFVNDYVNVLLYSNQSVSATLTGPDGPLVSGASYQYALTLNGGQPKSANITLPLPPADLPITSPESVSVGTTSFYTMSYSAYGVPDNVDAGRITVLPNSTFDRDGLLEGWKITTMATGNLTLLILRPVCLSTEVYCHGARACILPSESCSTLTASCQAVNVCPPYFSGTVQAIFAQEVNLPTIGTLGVLARNGSSHTHVLVGDMLGFYTPDGGVVGYDEWDLSYSKNAAFYSNSTADPYEAVTFSNLSDLLTYNVVREYGLAAMTTIPSKATFSRTLTAPPNSASSETVTVVVDSDHPPTSTTFSLSLNVVDPLVHVEAVVPKYAQAGAVVPLSAGIINGSVDSYTWIILSQSASPYTFLTISSTYNHVFSDIGAYTVILQADNVLGSRNSTMNYHVEVMDAISLADLGTNMVLPDVIGNQSQATLQINITSGSHIILYLDWGDGTLEVVNAPANLNTPYLFSRSHLYNSTGSFTVLATANNSVSSASVSDTLTVGSGVQAVALLYPSVLSTDLSGSVSAVLSSAVTTTPNYTFSVVAPLSVSNCSQLALSDYAPATSTSGPECLLAASTASTASGVLPIPGLYRVQVTVSDELGSASASSGLIHVQRPLANVTAAFAGCYNGDPTCAIVEVGALATVLLAFAPNDACVNSIDYDFGDGRATSVGVDTNGVCDTRTRSLTHTYATEGNYTLLLKASNAISSASAANTTIWAVQRINWIVPLEPLPTELGATTAFSISALSPIPTLLNPSGVTVTWDFGDGNQTTVSAANAAAVSHTYSAADSYNVTVTATNAISSVSRVFRHSVQPPAGRCLPPTTSLGSSSTAKVVFRKNALSLTADVSVDCDLTNTVSYAWTVFSSDLGSSAVPTSTADVQVLQDKASAGDLTPVALPASIPLTSDTLRLPKRALPIGVYVVQVQTTMSGTTISSTAALVLVVEGTAPVAIINGQVGPAALLVPLGSTLTVDGAASYDPDDLATAPLFFWSCRRVLSNCNSSSSNPDPADAGLADAECFRAAHGSFEANFNGSTSLKSLTLDVGWLRTYDAQEFVITLKVGREENSCITTSACQCAISSCDAELHLELTANAITTDIRIEEKLLGSRQAGDPLNPRLKVILQAVCDNCNANDTLSYSWQDTLTLTDCVSSARRRRRRRAATTPFPLGTLSLSGTSKQSLVLPPKSVTEEHTFRVTVTVTANPAQPSRVGAVGYAEITLTPNDFPAGGSCTVSLPPGTTAPGLELTTEFVLSCVGWSDSHHTANNGVGAVDLTYEYGYLNENDAFTQLHKSSVTNTTATLPSGDPLTVVFRIADRYGAVTRVQQNITVAELTSSSTTLDNTLVTLTVGSGSELQRRKSVGQQSRTLALVGVVATVMNRGPGSGSGSSNTTARAEVRTVLVATLATLVDNSAGSELDDETQTAMAVAIVSVTGGDSPSEELDNEAAVDASSTLHSLITFTNSDGDEDLFFTLLRAANNLIALSGQRMEASLLLYRQNSSATSLSAVEAKQNQSRTIVGNSRGSIDSLVNKFLQAVTADEEPVSLTLTDSVVQVARQTVAALTQLTYGGSSFVLPAGLFSSESEVFISGVVYVSTNPFLYAGNGLDRVSSQIASLEFYNSSGTGDELAVSGLGDRIDIFIPGADTAADLSGTEYTVSAGSSFTLQFERSSSQTNQTALLVVEPLAGGGPLTVFLRYGASVNESNYDLKMVTSVRSGGSSVLSDSLRDAAHALMVPPAGTSSVADFLAAADSRANITVASGGVQSGFGEAGNYSVLVVSAADSSASSTTARVLVFHTNCYYWSEAVDEWISDGCVVGAQATLRAMHCRCNHLTSFGSEAVVTPNTVNLISGAAKFSELADNPLVFILIVLIWTAYFIGLRFASLADQRDEARVGPIVLEDNSTVHHGRYEVMVMTGMRPNAGTSANVYVTLIGTRGLAGPRLLRHPWRPQFQRGHSDVFELTTPRDIGPITRVVVRHDNVGDAPRWFLSRLRVRNLNSEELTYFPCNRWLALDMDDGLIQRELYALSEEDMKTFSNAFQDNLAFGLANNHVWLSVFTRPPQSRFTRVQRLSVVLMLLLLTLLTSAMFYQTDDEDLSATQQLFVGLVSSLIVFPLSFWAVFAFQRARADSERFNRVVPLDTAEAGAGLKEVGGGPPAGGHKQAWTPESSFVRPELQARHQALLRKALAAESSSLSGGGGRGGEVIGEQPLSEHTMLAAERSISLTGKAWLELMALNEVEGIENADLALRELEAFMAQKQREIAAEQAAAANKRSFEQRMCPCLVDESGRISFAPWVRTANWVMVIGVCILASYWIVLFGLDFGARVSAAWMQSLVLSLFTSIVVLQPLKVMLLALVIALLWRSHVDRDKPDDEPPPNAEQCYELTQQKLVVEMLARKQANRPSRFPRQGPELEKARARQLRERKMGSVLREFLIYLVFFWILATVNYVDRGRRSFELSQSLDQAVVRGGDYTVSGRERPTTGFREVETRERWWQWVEETLVPGLNFETWYNGDNTGLTGFLHDGDSYLVGAARFRQLRVENHSCTVADEFEDTIARCQDWWSMDSNEGGLYASHNASSSQTWQYFTPGDLTRVWLLGKTDMYNGGGYTQDLPRDLSSLQSLVADMKDARWLDEQTRAVVTEIIVYSASSNLFGVASLLAEFPPTGGAFQVVSLGGMRVYRYSDNPNDVLLLFADIVFVLLLCYYTHRMVSKMRRLGWAYFRGWQNWVDLLILIFSYTLVVIYIYRYVTARRAMSRYRDSDQSSFIDAIWWLGHLEALVVVMSGLLMFLGTLRFLFFFRHNKFVNLLNVLLRRAAKRLLAFLIIFSVTFLNFAALGYLAFGSGVAEYGSFGQSIFTLFSLLLGEFTLELFQVYRITGPIFFTAFVLSNVFILLNVFVAIFYMALAELRHDRQARHEEQLELLTYVAEQLALLTGLRSRKRPKVKVDVAAVAADLDIKLDGIQDALDRLGERRSSRRQTRWSDGARESTGASGGSGGSGGSGETKAPLRAARQPGMAGLTEEEEGEGRGAGGSDQHRAPTQMDMPTPPGTVTED